MVTAVYKTNINTGKQMSKLSCAFGGIKNNPVICEDIIKNWYL